MPEVQQLHILSRNRLSEIKADYCDKRESPALKSLQILLKKGTEVVDAI